MMKRVLASVVISGLTLAGGSVAWAQAPPKATPAERDARKAAAKACVAEAAQTKDRAALKACLEAAGIDRRPAAKRRTAPAGSRGVHGEMVVKAKDGTFQTVEFDRGKVAEATTMSSIVLDRPDGQSVTLALTDTTRYRGIDGAAAIRKGRPAQVISKDGKALVVKQGNPGNKAPRAVVPTR